MQKKTSYLYLTDTWVFYVCYLRCIQHKFGEIIDLSELMTKSYDHEKILVSVIFISFYI